jgi:opacity protein-like surface antigen
MVGIIGLVLVWMPHSAQADRSDALTGVSAIGAVAAIGCWTTALAGADDEQPEGEFSRRGWLVGAAGTYAIESGEGDAESSLEDLFGRSVNFSLKNSFGFAGRAGYRCHERVSAEVEVEWLDGFDGTAFLDGPGDRHKLDFEPVVVTVNAKGYLMTGRTQPFLRVGGGLLTVKTTLRNTATGESESDHTTDFAMRFGGGIDFYATRNVVLTGNLDYLLPFGSLEDLDFVSIGLGVEYRF